MGLTHPERRSGVERYRDKSEAKLYKTNLFGSKI
jgi:hypothetical protein